MTALTQFRVQRYGHFEDHTVAFGPGCTVVYGENEAGKSTLLDALSDFLWGFPAKNHPREFVYKRNQMLLEGTVDVEGHGAHLYTRQPPRLSCDGAEIDAAPWGADLNRGHWEHAYGLNLPRLEKGGRDIVGGKDDPGGISFLADTGLPIDDLRDSLVKKKSEIFVAHGGNTKSAIRRLLNRLQELDTRIGELGASAKDVENLEIRLDDLKTTLTQNQRLMATLDDDIRVNGELLRAFDDVQRLQQLDEQIEQLAATGAVLDEGATGELAEALGKLRALSVAITEHSDSLEANRAQLNRIEPRRDVLDRTADIRSAVREIEARKADASVLLDTSAAANHRQAVVNLLDELGESSDDLEAARRSVTVPTDRHEQLDRRAQSLEAAEQALSTQQKRVRDAQVNLEQQLTPAAGSETLLAQLARRDEAWQAVREPWISGDLPSDVRRAELAARLDAAIQVADDEAERAATALEKLGESRGKRQQAEASLDREKAQLAEAEAIAATARDEWSQLADNSGLPTGTDGQAWRVRADLLNRLNEAWKKWQDEESRHRSARERLDVYQAQVNELARLLTTPSGDALTDIDALDDLLNEAENRETQLANVQSAIDKEKDKLTAAEADHVDCLASIQSLAAGADAEDLLKRSTEYHRLHEQRANTVQLIAVATPSMPDLAATQAALGDRDRASLQAEAAELSSQRVAVGADVAEGERAVGATQSELSRLQQREGTAALLAERQEVSARIAELAEQYRLLHVQELILNSYAKLNADRSDTPVLDRAGAYLQILTGGRHQGFSITTVGTEKHLRIQSLVGDTVQDIEPANLSDGTEHQVYFALRLAGMAARQEERRRKGLPTIPVVLDDVFQAFDDERSGRALELLAELGREFQIIVMTHERAIYDIAEAMPEVETVHLTTPRVPAQV